MKQAVSALLAIVVVVVLAAIAWPLLAQRFADRWASSLETGHDDPEAAYEALLALDADATATLVRHAASTDPGVAEPARRALAVRVDAWRARAARGRFDYADRLEALVRQFENHATDFNRSGKRWAMRFVTALLSDTPLVKTRRRAGMIAAVDRLLEQLASTPSRPDPLRPESEDNGPLIAAKNPPPLRPRPSANDAASDRVVSLPPPPSERRMVSTPTPPAREPRLAEGASPPSGWRPKWGANDRADEPRRFVAQPAQELPEATLTRGEELARLTDRELLAELLAVAADLPTGPRATGPASARRAPPPTTPEVEAVRAALHARGYRGVALGHVRSLLSESVAERQRLVDRLLVERTGDTGRLLMLLARDESAEVRASALAALGASVERAVAEAARDLAIRDSDPRVAGVAEEINRRLQ